MAHPANIVAAGMIGAIVGGMIGGITTLSFNLFFLGCQLVENDHAKLRTAEIVFQVGIILGALLGAVLAIRYVCKPRNPS